MYKKVFICTILIISILVAGCGKTELDPIETVNLYLNSGYKDDASLAKGTILNDEVSAFVFNIDKEMQSGLMYNALALPGLIYTQDEFNRLMQAMNKIRAMTKIQVDYKYRNETTARLKVKILKINTREFKSRLNDILRANLEEDKDKFLRENFRKADILKISMPYIVNTFEETTEEFTKNEDFLTEADEYFVDLRYNKITKKWELVNPNDVVRTIIRMNAAYFKI